MEIKLPCYGIVVDIEGVAGQVVDELHETIQYNPDHPDYDGPEDITWKENYNNMMDGITSLILGHACAGIDITTPAYIEGIETAVEACGQYA